MHMSSLPFNVASNFHFTLEKKAGLTQNRGRPLWLAKDPCHQGDQCPPDTKNCEGIISESLRSFLIFITGQWCWFVKRKKLMNVLFFSFLPTVVGVRREK